MLHLPGGGAGGAGVLFLPAQVMKMFFRDAADVSEAIMHYILMNTPSVSVVSVPGNGRGYRNRTSRARRSTAALVKWFCDLHALGYAIDGVFTRHSFGIDHLGYLKGSSLLLFLVKPIHLTVDGVSRNMAGVAAMIEHDIHSSLPLPLDLTHLVDCLKKYNIGLSALVQSHIANEDEDIKTALFMKLYKRLKVIGRLDPARHGSIMQAIQQFSGVTLWLASAMSNTHMHSVLRFTRRKRKGIMTMTNVVFAFLTTKVQYADDLAGLLTCRRNGKAHMEADASVDGMGYMEAAIFGAAEGLKTYHQRKYNNDVAAGVQPLEPLASRLLKPISKVVASVVATALEQFLLSGAQLSLEAAKAGAAAAANYLVSQPNILLRSAHFGLNQNAVQAASTAAQGWSCAS